MPRQCGKTTLARQLVSAASPNYFDLEDPVSLARLDQPLVALRDLTGTVVIDEVQHRPDLFPVLRVLADRVIAEAAPDEVYFWATHNGAELDLLLMTAGRRVGVEVKRVDAPRRTRSMAVALDDLRLDALYVVYPGDVRYVIDDRITALPASARFPALETGVAATA